MKITVITPTLNRAHTIRDAIESVLDQGSVEFEHLVMDGQSTDDTLDVLNQYPHLTVVSQQDDGLYDAINHGIELSTGDIICHLNSDDMLAPGAFAAIVSRFKQDSKLESVAGGVEVFTRNSNGEDEILYRINAEGIKALRLADITHGVPIINARFFHRKLYERIGLYDLRYPVAADRAFLMKAFLNGMIRDTVPGVVYRYQHHDGSLTLRNSPIFSALQDNLKAAAEGLIDHQARGTPRSCYRKWHAWSAIYLIADQIRAGQPRSTSKTLGKAFRTDPLFPLHGIPELIHHWKTRQERRWSEK